MKFRYLKYQLADSTLLFTNYKISITNNSKVGIFCTCYTDFYSTLREYVNWAVFILTAPLSSGTTQAVADGYWIFLKPLPIGEYSIHVKGEQPFYRSKVTYEINVVDK